MPYLFAPARIKAGWSPTTHLADLEPISLPDEPPSLWRLAVRWRMLSALALGPVVDQMQALAEHDPAWRLRT